MEDESVDSPSTFYKYLTPKRKLNAENPFFWKTHRGGWTDVGRLINKHLHTPDGVLYLSAVEDQLWYRKSRKEGPLEEPWVGFMHQMPRQHLDFWDLDRIVKHDLWNESIKHCRGLWTLTDYQKSYLQHLNVPVPIAKVYYPIETPKRTFSYQKFIANPARQVLCIGEFLRNFQFFYDLEAPGYRKVLLKYDNFDNDLKSQMIKLTINGSVEVRPTVDVEAYDSLFEDNIVLLNLLDAGAVTTIIECIVRGTPVLVNRVGGVAEYLGDDYPFYADTLEEANIKLQDTRLIFEAAKYLKEYNFKKKLTGSYFLSSLQNTAIYRMLPVPRGQC
jgi:glycosyltransferase involved in cell wall biosynthesis